MWRTGLRPTHILRAFDHALHIKCLVYTAHFSGGVEDTGNLGCNQAPRDEISKTPEMHSLDLEKQRSTQSPTSEGLGKSFHFSYDNYGYY